MNFRRITNKDTDWHERFFALVETVFLTSGSNFRPWNERGGWHPGYEVFAIELNGDILATVGRERMRFVIDGKEHDGYQLGAVATHPDRRGQGLSRRLLSWVLGDIAGRPVILFGNARVVDFYPRFGFTRIAQSSFTEPVTVEAAHPAPTLDLEDPEDRAWLAALCARARSPGVAFSARDYYPTLLWHLTYKPRPVFRLDEANAAVVASVEEERLVLHDLIALWPFDLRRVLPQLTSSRVSALEFGFGPEDWWPSATASLADEPDSPFFVRNLPPLPTRAFRFPDLAQT